MTNVSLPANNISNLGTHPMQSKTAGDLKNFENARDEMYVFLYKHHLPTDRLPSKAYLVREGMSNLVNAIKIHHGGVYAFAEALGMKTHKDKPIPYNLIRIDMVQREIDEFTGTTGEMPLYEDMRDKSAHALINHIQIFGGIPKVAKLLGYQSNASRNPNVWNDEEAFIDALYQASIASSKPGHVLSQSEYYGQGNGNLYQKLCRCRNGKSSPNINTICERLLEKHSTNLQSHHSTDSIANDIWKILGNPAIDQKLHVLLAIKYEWLKNVPEETISKWCNAKTLPVSQNPSERKPSNLSSKEGKYSVEPVDEQAEFGNFLTVMVRICWVNLIKVLIETDKPLTQAPDQATVNQVIKNLFPGKENLELVKKVYDSFADSVNQSKSFKEKLTNFGWKDRDLFLYQADVANQIMKTIHAKDARYILIADQPGLGKTTSAIAGMVASGAKRILIITKKCIADDTWYNTKTGGEIGKCLKKGSFTVARGIQNVIAQAEKQADLFIGIIHFEELRSKEKDKNGLTSFKKLAKMNFDCMCEDEIHLVKKRSGCDESAIRKLVGILRKKCHAAIGLTGTPLLNDLSEPLSLLQLLSGEDDKFLYPNKKKNKISQEEMIAVYETMLPHMIRHQTEEVLLSLPHFKLESFEIASNASMDNTANWVKMRKLSIQDKLPHIFNRASEDGKLIVFTYLAEGVGNVIANFLTEKLGKDKVGYICGKTNDVDRNNIVNSFKTPDGIKILVATIGTMGTGLTLFDPDQEETAHRILFADLPYRHADLKQSICRLYRQGQKQNVLVDILISVRSDHKITHDQHVWELLKLKENISEQAIDGILGKTCSAVVANQVREMTQQHL